MALNARFALAVSNKFSQLRFTDAVGALCWRREPVVAEVSDEARARSSGHACHSQRLFSTRAQDASAVLRGQESFKALVYKDYYKRHAKRVLKLVAEHSRGPSAISRTRLWELCQQHVPGIPAKHWMGDILKRLRREGYLTTKVLPSDSSKRPKRGFELTARGLSSVAAGYRRYLQDNPPLEGATFLDEVVNDEALLQLRKKDGEKRKKPRTAPPAEEPWDSFERVRSKALELAATRSDAYSERDAKQREEGRWGKVENRVLKSSLHAPNGAALRRARDALRPDGGRQALAAIDRWARQGFKFVPAQKEAGAAATTENPPF